MYFLFYCILFYFILFSLFLFQVFNFKTQFPHFSISFFIMFSTSNLQFPKFIFKVSQFLNSNLPIFNFKFLNPKPQIYKIQNFNFKSLISKSQFKILMFQIHFRILNFQYIKLPTLKFQFQNSFQKFQTRD